MKKKNIKKMEKKIKKILYIVLLIIVVICIICSCVYFLKDGKLLNKVKDSINNSRDNFKHVGL